MAAGVFEVTFQTQMKVKEIHIINKTSSFLSSSSESLLYLPMKAYVIRTTTLNRFFGENDFSVLGQITTKEKKYFLLEKPVEIDSKKLSIKIAFQLGEDEKKIEH